MPIAEPIAVSVDDGARLIGVSRAFLYQSVLSGACPSMKLGARRLIPVSGLRAWIESQSNGGAA
jgi:excisionase family DNA binding protein